MFNLEQAIEKWCATLTQQYRPSSDDLDELKDHIFSAVEASIKSGKSEQQAFDKVIAEFGDLTELGEQFGKKDNRLVRWLVACENKQQHCAQKQSRSQQSIWLAVIFALGIIFAAVQIEDTKTSMTIMLMLIAMWFSVDLMKNGSSAAREWRCLKRWWHRRMGA